jgi:putative two-component system response regulator
MQKLIFIVDDNDTNLAVAAAALESEYRIMTMPSAIAMFTLLKKQKPDLIILDVEMPEMGGFDALVALKNNSEWINIPVVFLTGWYDEGLVADALELGIHEVVSKPLVPDVLLKCVQKYLSRA